MFSSEQYWGFIVQMEVSIAFKQILACERLSKGQCSISASVTLNEVNNDGTTIGS